jgi:signal transduction histidine kinase
VTLAATSDAEQDTFAGQVVGDVAHDLNNLLAAIVNYASFVDEEIAAEIALRPAQESARLNGVLDDVRQIAAAAEHAARLTQQLLAVKEDS